MNYLAIDLGDKYCGLAYNIGELVFSLPGVSRVALVQHLKPLIKEKQIQTIVVGEPYDLYGINTKQLYKTQKFIKKLTALLPDINIVGYDERYTTFLAKETLHGLSKEKIQHYKDSMSAYFILESYLLQQKNS